MRYRGGDETARKRGSAGCGEPVPVEPCGFGGQGVAAAGEGAEHRPPAFVPEVLGGLWALCSVLRALRTPNQVKLTRVAAKPWRSRWAAEAADTADEADAGGPALRVAGMGTLLS